jgi:predicted phage terminase large subunit-like protein
MLNSTELLTAAKSEKAIRLARSSFWHFRLLMHKDLVIGAWHKEASEHLQQWYDDYIAGKRPKILITVPPQHGKTTLVCDFILWLAGKNTDTKIIYASFSDMLGKRANRYFQRHTKKPVFKLIFPDFSISKETQELVLTGENGYFRNTTCGGSVTGETLDVGVLDDLMKGRDEANSAAIREKKWEWLLSDFFTRFSDKGGLIGIMTRWHVNDPFGRLIESIPEIKLLKYPAINDKNEPLFPELKSLEFLEGIKKTMPVMLWESLYQQNPIIAEGNFFKPDLIPVIQAEPSGLIKVRAWDFAATANGGDYTVGFLFGYNPQTQNGSVLDIVRGQYAPEEVKKVLKNTAIRDGKGVKILLPQDPGQAGKSQSVDFVKLLSGFIVAVHAVSGSKENRASPVASQVNVGNISMLKAGWNRDFIEELRNFPNGKNDDQVDALSDCYNNFVNQQVTAYIPTRIKGL